MITLKDGRQLYASPEDDTQTEFLNWVSQTKKSLLILDYSFNIQALGTILPELKSKGITVQLCLDRSQSKGKNEEVLIAELKKAGLDIVIGTSDKHQIMHDKVAIRDDSVIYGSWNFSLEASSQDNFYVIDPNPDVIAFFTNQFNNIRQWIVENEPQN
jgi:phosphatidylserine/phosphatidylglycerophosphate/cardiolipin synthase-like enzyme